MLSIPLELAGVFGALLIAGQTFSTVSILGIIMGLSRHRGKKVPDDREALPRLSLRKAVNR